MCMLFFCDFKVRIFNTGNLHSWYLRRLISRFCYAGENCEIKGSQTLKSFTVLLVATKLLMEQNMATEGFQPRAE